MAQFLSACWRLHPQSFTQLGNQNNPKAPLCLLSLSESVFTRTRRGLLGMPKLSTSPATPDGQRDISRRKQLLLGILDALHELQDEDLTGQTTHAVPGRKNSALIEDPTEGPNADEHIQTEGARSFQLFQLRVQELDGELQKFSNAITQLGSSVCLLSTSFHLRQRISRILHLVRSNAAELFPRKIRKESNAPTELLRAYSRVKIRYKRPPNAARPIISDDLGMESFPQEIEGLAKDTMSFLDSLNEFPEFCDESVNASIIAFEGDLKYWASCLREFKGQFRFPGVTRYVHDLATEIGEHFENITAALVVFVEVGVPTIKFGQKHGTSNLLNLSTISTFFSAVTATTIQFSFDRTEGLLDNWVNALWYSSLVFSIASSVNSLVGLTWRQASYRSPGHRVPWWISMWIKRSPLIFLIISVTTFSVGLCLFTYATGQPHTVSLMVTAFTVCSSFGLLAVSSWFAFERFVYNKHRGRIWLSDALDETNARIRKVLGIEWAIRVPPVHIKRFITTVVHGLLSLVQSVMQCFMQCFKQFIPPRARGISVNEASLRPSGTFNMDIEAQSMDEYKEPPPPQAIGSLISHSTFTFTGMESPIFAQATSPEPPTPRTSSTLLGVRAESTEDITPEGGTKRNQRFRNAVQMVIRSNESSLLHKRLAKSGSIGHGQHFGAKMTGIVPYIAARLMRIKATQTELAQLTVIHKVPAHQGLVRNLAFSPNGQLIATCSWDRTSAILKVSDMSSHRTLAHPNGFVAQVVWCPNGSLLLAKLTSGITIWTEDGVCKERIDRRTAVHSMVWFANGTEFLSVETTEAVHLDIEGQVIDRYQFDRLRLRDIAITKNGERLFAVATLDRCKDDHKPVKAKAEKRIVVYNRLEKEIEIQIPVLQDICNITLSKNDRFVLVGYENKAPPQLWRINLARDDPRIALANTYIPSKETDFSGPCSFGGNNDQLVFCASKAGDIHVWDRESGSLLHHFVPSSNDGDLTCVAWNNASDRLMFSTGAYDGTVRLWGSIPEVTPQPATHHVSTAIISNRVARDEEQRRGSRDVLPVTTEVPEDTVSSTSSPTSPPARTTFTQQGQLHEEPEESLLPRPESPQQLQERKQSVSFSEPPVRLK
ncbi:WD40 repeat-like protein [Auriculariales sp. MPI-PUGE-AT-0066]|nr:WD40 repeat-like protein [Auriculariales sp. MPI-PUGE-AT-0066]